MSPIPRPFWRRPLFLGLAVVLALLGVTTNLLLRPTADGMEAFPHAFIAQPGYDPALIEFVVAPIEAPPPAPSDGLAPAWQCNDPAFRDAQGRPWLFPVPTTAEPPVLPLHPILKRRPSLATCQCYRSAEADRQIAAYREGRQP